MLAVAFQNLRRRLWTPTVLAPLALALIGALGLIFRLSDLAGREPVTKQSLGGPGGLGRLLPAAALAAGQYPPRRSISTVWATVKIWGGREWVLRSLSFTFGVGALVVIWRLARALTYGPSPSWPWPWWPAPRSWSTTPELKQYSGDAFFAVLVFYLKCSGKTSATAAGRPWP